MTAAPLAGLTVLEAASPAAPPGLVAAGALCGRVMADLGAAVTRVDPGTGLNEAEARFLHAGKRILRAASGTQDGLAAGLAAGADVAILDAALALPAPCRVAALLSMDAAGTPQQSEFTVEARSGLLDIVGEPDRAPLRLAGHQTAYAAGLAAFTAIMAALALPATGTHRVVRINLLDTAIWLNWKSLAVAAGTGVPPKRAGRTVEWPVLPCADGHVALVYRAQEWSRVMQALPDPALQDARFQSAAGRRQHRAALNGILARQVASLTRAELRALALRHKLPFGAVWQPGELLDDPHMRDRGAFHAAVPRLPAIWNGRRPQAGSAA